MERDRAPLGELRQVAEETLNETGDTVPLRKTGCLGPCSDGHVMGIADSEEGVYLFTMMNEEETVRSLARAACRAARMGDVQIPGNLKQHLEARLSPDSISEIPFED